MCDDAKTPRPAGITVAVPFGTEPDWLTRAKPAPYSAGAAAGFTSRLCREIERRAGRFRRERFDTIYFAGCGPSLLGLEQLYAILQVLCDRLAVDPQEQTLTVLADTVVEGKAKVLMESGFDRVLLRLDDELRRDCFQVLRRAGFATVGVELPYGNERLLDQVLALEPDHVTFLFSRLTRGKEPAAVRAADQRMTGWRHYCLHHYCQPGHECRHLQAVHGEAVVVGFGPGAVTRTGNTVASNPETLADYLAGRPCRETRLTAADRLLDALQRLDGVEPSPATRALAEAGLLEERDGRFYLSDRGVTEPDRVRTGLGAG